MDTFAECYLNAVKPRDLAYLSAQYRKLSIKAGNPVEVNVIGDPANFIAEESLD